MFVAVKTTITFKLPEERKLVTMFREYYEPDDCREERTSKGIAFTTERHFKIGEEDG